ncbi:MAG: pseudaminic acid synthase [Bacteroides sp. SM23_62]|nr:MAG: pseudaminic acid synthase [Bacteroides sp. SM23_62]
MALTNLNRTFIVAELSANHAQKKEIAVESIKAAKNAGADAIKLQTYKPNTMTLECDNQYFQITEGLWKGQNLYQLYKEAYTPWEWHEDLFNTAREEGLICFSTPFDRTAVDFLEQFNPPAYKIASFELVDIPLIRYTASKNRTMIMSTGMAKFHEIEEAVDACREVGNNDIFLLKCTSSYPAPLSELNLATIPDLKKQFNVEVGLSDHTKGIIAPIVAAALGARIIEKHFIMNKEIGGPDAAFSLDEKEFAEMVDAVRKTESVYGKVTYELTEKVKLNRIFSRSLFIVEDVKAGEVFTEENIKSIRPNYGVEPKFISDIIGKKAKKDITKGTPFTWDLI